MATKRNNHQSHTSYKKSQIHAATPQNNSRVDIPLTTSRAMQRKSLIDPLDVSEIKKAHKTYNGYEYQLIPVEIEKEAEIGLVVGQIEGEQWVFVDEILPNGMIDMNGTIKEGDYLIQVGMYSLVEIDVTTALDIIKRAYDEGRKTLSFVAARQQKPDLTKLQKTNVINKEVPKPDLSRDRKGSRARSFVEYENEEEEAYNEVDDTHGRRETDDTKF